MCLERNRGGLNHFNAGHSGESGNPEQPLCRLSWTPASAGVTGGGASTKSDDAPAKTRQDIKTTGVDLLALIWGRLQFSNDLKQNVFYILWQNPQFLFTSG